MAIQELNLDIRHRSGKSNVVADALSRNPALEENSIFQIEVSDDSGTQPPCDPSLPHSEISQLQHEDEELSSIIAYLEEGKLPEKESLARRLATEKSHYEIVEGVLHYVTSEGHGQLG